MKILVFLLGLLCTISPGAPRRPEVQARLGRGGHAKTIIDRFEVDVLFFEDLAQTTITVSFENTSTRNIEGELSLPLPQGATISGYQLEVNGKFRESTTVTKERARFAYESIKRQNIDPGYVERLPGNIYRTRIFPILRNSSKALRLTYCHPLNQKNDHLEYLLMLPKIVVKNAKITLTHLQNRKLEIATPSTGTGTRWTYSAEKNDHQLNAPDKVTLDRLHCKLPKVRDELSVDTGQYTYQRRQTKPQGINDLLQKSQTLDLVWDSSESGHARGHKKEFAYLDKLFKQHPNLTVRLIRLRLVPEPPETFEIKNGDWKKLRETLNKTFYDGGTDLASFRPGESPAIIFSDGHSFHSRLEHPWPKPITFVDANGVADPYWIDQTILSGGIFLNLSSPPEEHHQVTRRFTRKETRRANDFNKDAELIIKTLWSSEKLRSLESQFTPNQEAIIDFSKEHHLVSHETSLIVLERFEDHVRYRIPPPEEDLLKKYLAAIKRFESLPSATETMAKRWQRRKNWHESDYPWQNSLLEPSVARIAIWKRALLKTFDKSELNQESLKEVEKTIARVNQLNQTKSSGKLDTLEAYKAWLNDIQIIANRLSKLESLPYGAGTEGKIAVAVNGFVKSGGKILTKQDAKLKDALRQVGGITKIGSASRVSLYRGSRKTTYNLLSKEYTEVRLKPGDLIVVERAYEPDDMLDDPFSGAAPEPVDYRNEPAVILPSHTPNYVPRSDNGAAGGGDPFALGGGGGGSQSAPPSLFNIAQLDDPKALDLDALLKTVSEAPDALELYRKARPHPRYRDSFYLQLGDLFLKAKKPKLAQRVLSNLLETAAPRPTAYRKWAYLLAKHEDWSGAQALLERAKLHAPNDHAIALDQTWISLKQKKQPEAITRLKGITTDFDPSDSLSGVFAEIATEDAQNILGKIDLPLDLRVVVACASGQSLDLRVSEPSNSLTSFSKWSSPSVIGARTLEAVGVAEYSLRQAAPGQYSFSYRTGIPQIVRLQVYRNWGRKNQTCDEQVILLPVSRTRRTLASFRFELE